MTPRAGRGAPLAALVLLLLALFTAPAWAAPKFPPLTGRVVDDAHVLTPEVQASLTAKLADLEAKTSRQLVVVTLPSLGGYDIADYGYQLLRAWGIGQKGTNNGALFIVVPSEHKVRIEVGYGLEPILTDALSSVILQQAVIPKFRAGDVSGGIVDGTSAIIDQLSLDPSAAEQKAAAAEQAQRAPMRRSNPIGGIIPLIFMIFIVSRLFRGGYGGGLGMLLPLMFLSGGRGGWGGGGGFGGFGGGGFSGGGGSGGGGGASGSW
ncbi:MAG TPA: TPM domain-containing protein [Caulobacteraceae bacterium]|nr:TPM domain-containing protein [Caulobacteraceae bacterium]